MDLSDYLIKVDRRKINNDFLKEGYLGNNLLSDYKNNLKDFNVVIVGINEFRNSIVKDAIADTYLIRQYLYRLTGFPKVRIVDLGDLKPGKTILDTYTALKELSDYFINKGIFLLAFGGTQELSLSCCESILRNKKKAEIGFIDAKIDDENGDLHSQSFLSNSMLADNHEIIKSVLAYQSYFSPSNKIRELSSKGYNFYRLGLIRENMAFIEPILRDADLISFDLGAVRQSDNPGAIFKSPNGLYAEEACQLAYLSGISDKLTHFHISELNQKTDVNNQSVHLMAQIIWHVISGISSRHSDYPHNSLKKYKKIFVKTDKIKEELVFYQNEFNQRFWMEVPGEMNNEIDIISCSEYDYKAVCSGEIPDRLWKRISNTMH